MGRTHVRHSEKKPTSSSKGIGDQHSPMRKLHYDYNDGKAMKQLKSCLQGGGLDHDKDDEHIQEEEDASYEDDADSAAEALPLDVRAAPGTATLERRRMQNRLAQQRMRQRKESKMDELQAELDQQDKMMTELRAENRMLRAEHLRLCSDGSSSQSWSMQSYTDASDAEQARLGFGDTIERSYSAALANEHRTSWLAPFAEPHSLSGSSFGSAKDGPIFSATTEQAVNDAPLFPRGAVALPFAGHDYFSTSHDPPLADQQQESTPTMSLWT